MIFITSFDRPRLLLRLLKELDCNTVVIDDGSDYNPSEHMKYCTYYRTPHRGKEQYYKQWGLILDMARRSGDKHFYFLADDWNSVDIGKATYFLENTDKPFAFNFTNNGVETNWTPLKQQKTKLAGEPVYKVGWVDCGFFCNRQALERIGFFMHKVPESRFDRPDISSGVGQQLSNRFMRAGVDMYKPITSLAWHDGTHESKMHKEERKRNPLIPR